MGIRLRSISGRPVIFGLWLATLVMGPTARAADAGRSEEEFFEAKVRPVLVEHCLECHGAEKSKAGLRLDAREAMLRGGDGGPAVVPGKPEESSLVSAIRYDGDVQMPPSGKLKETEIAALSEWVRRGARWPASRPGAVPVSTAAPVSVSVDVEARARSFWAFRPIEDPAPPDVRGRDWPRSPIDRFILARLEGEGLSPSSEADRATLIRRLSYDLVGLPPSPEEVEAFAKDSAPDAYERLVERLLASPHYGERWGRIWLDIARYGEDQAHSFQPRLYPFGYRYRDWVFRAINRDLPYDRFLVEQIAGDLLDGPESSRIERLEALGFFACGPVYYGDAKKLDQYDDRIDTMCRGFLGLTVACARCHDHKYDPIPTSDYYALQGVFASTEYVEVPAAPREQVEAHDRAMAAIAEKEKAITAAVRAEAKKQGKTVAGGQLKAFERMLTGEAKRSIQAMRAELDQMKKKAPAKYPVIHALADASKPVDMPILARGNPKAPGAKVPRHFLGALGGSTFRKGSGRLELARAIASPDNPLTARVMVNRVWQHHFGRGLVATASNFGSLGERPSHPELLDWLARRFIESGWSLKALHREIVTSAAYRQSSRASSPSADRDPGNVLLGRMNRRRLDIESWRDAMLAVAGRLDESIGGPSIDLERPDNARRTAYAKISRHDLAGMLRLFDFPDPNITSGGRIDTTVPLQQLFVLNSEMMATSARAVAARLHQPGENTPDDSSRIRRAYQWLYAREPSEREIRIGLAYLQAGDPTDTTRPDLSRWDRYAQALLAANEFAFVD